MASGRAIFEVKQSGARRAAGSLSRAAREIRRLMLSEMRAEAPELQDVFVSYAPYDADERDDYHLQDHITARVSTAGRIQITLRAEARDPRSGFDYLDVTRYGHRGTITPDRAKMLAWRAGGAWHRAQETAGSHPASDWVEDAAPEAEHVSDAIAERVGRVVYTRLLA